MTAAAAMAYNFRNAASRKYYYACLPSANRPVVSLKSSCLN